MAGSHHGIYGSYYQLIARLLRDGVRPGNADAMARTHRPVYQVIVGKLQSDVQWFSFHTRAL